jgi:predicted Zn-dependent protease
VEKDLQAAIKLAPRYAPAYDALAMLYAERHEKLDEAHTMGVMAVALDPDNLNYRMNAANALAEAGNTASALGAEGCEALCEDGEREGDDRGANLVDGVVSGEYRGE